MSKFNISDFNYTDEQCAIMNSQQTVVIPVYGSTYFVNESNLLKYLQNCDKVINVQLHFLNCCMGLENRFKNEHKFIVPKNCKKLQLNFTGMSPFNPEGDTKNHPKSYPEIEFNNSLEILEVYHNFPITQQKIKQIFNSFPVSLKSMTISYCEYFDEDDKKNITNILESMLPYGCTINFD